MKIILKSLILFSVVNLVMMPSCKSSKITFDPENTTQDFITFGNGGGITGQSKKYYFTNDGKIYLQNIDSIQLVTTLPVKTSAQIFESYMKLGLDKNILNEPGNRYYFLEMKTKDMNHALKWGRNELLNPNIEKFYTILMNFVKQKTENKK